MVDAVGFTTIPNEGTPLGGDMLTLGGVHVYDTGNISGIPIDTYNETLTNVTAQLWWIEHPVLHVFAQVVVPCLSVVGMIANFATILAVWTHELRQNLNSILIGNMSAAQLIYCATVMTFQTAIFHQPDLDWSQDFCNVVVVIRTWLAGTTLSLLSAIAFYRYLNVVHIQSYRKYSTRIYVIPVLLVCWLNGFAFAIPPAFKSWGSYRFERIVSLCTFSKDGDKSNRIATLTIGFILPVVAIICCYSRIAVVAIKSQNRMNKHRQKSIKKKLSFRQKISRESLRLAMMMAIIFFVFLGVATPYMLVHTLDNSMEHPVHHIWTSILAWFLYCVNPFIYTAMDKNFQNAYKEILTFKICVASQRLFSTMSSMRSHASERRHSTKSNASQGSLRNGSLHGSGPIYKSTVETNLNGETKVVNPAKYNPEIRISSFDDDRDNSNLLYGGKPIDTDDGVAL